MIRSSFARAVLGAFLLASASFAYWTPPKAPHQWGVLNFGGGGFVTGINASPNNALFARTDVGGGYKFDRSTMTWKALMDWAPDSMPGLFQTASIGFDMRSTYKTSVYYLTGTTNRKGDDRLMISRDEGDSFRSFRIQPPDIINAPGDTTKFDISANGELRRRGDRVIVTNSGKYLVGGDGSPLYFTRTPTVPTSWAIVNGLYGKLGTRKKAGISFIAIDTATSPNLIYVGVTAAMSTGPVVYRSNDDGVSWIALTSPVYTDLMFGANYATAKANRGNIMPMRGLVSRKGILYVTLGDAKSTAGAVWKLPRGAGTFADATPLNSSFLTNGGAKKHFVPYCGMDLLSGSTVANDTLVVGTFAQTDPQRWIGVGIDDTPGGDNIFTSINSGVNWLSQFATRGANPTDAYTVLTQALFNPNAANQPDWLFARAMHWSSGVAIDRKLRTRVFSGSGNGIWGTDNMDWGFKVDPTVTIKDDKAKRKERWIFRGQGVQELVPYGLMFGENNSKIAGFLDYGAFQWTDPTLQTKRLSTGASSNTELVNAPNNLKVMARIVAAGVVWISQDNGVTWGSIPQPALTVTGKGGRVLLLSADGKALYFRAPDYSWWRTTDLAAGSNWTQIQSATSGYVNLVVDPRQGAIVYSLNPYKGELSRSTDYGSTFQLMDMTGKLPGAWGTAYVSKLPNRSSISNVLGTVTASPGRSGDLWISTSFVTMGGMWRIRNAHTDNFTVEKLGQGTLDSICKQNAYYSYACPSTKDGQVIAQQLWVGAPKVAGGEPSVYVKGWLTSKGGPTQQQGTGGGYIWGLFRSNDGGKTWEDIEDPKYRFGGMGDAGTLWVSPTVYGEFYQSTAGRGIAWARSAVVKPGVLTSAVTGVDKNIVTLTYGGAEGFFVNKVVFKEGATTLCEATAAPYTCVVVGGATGNRTFTASVYSGTATTPRYTLTTVAAVQFTYKLNIGWTLAGKYYRATVNMPANNTVTLSVLDATGKAVRIKAGVPVVKGANTVSVYWPRISTSAAYKSVLTAPGIYVTGTFSR